MKKSCHSHFVLVRKLRNFSWFSMRDLPFSFCRISKHCGIYIRPTIRNDVFFIIEFRDARDCYKFLSRASCWTQRKAMRESDLHIFRARGAAPRRPCAKQDIWKRGSPTPVHTIEANVMHEFNNDKIWAMVQLWYNTFQVLPGGLFSLVQWLRV